MAWLDPIRETLSNLLARFARTKSLMVRLAERERRYRTLFEAANDAIFILQGDRFVQCNSRTLAIYGCTQEQILGETPYRFSPPTQPDGQNSRKKALQKLAAAQAGEPQFFEWRHLRYDGTPFDAEISLNLVELSDGSYIQAIVRDVSERKRSEAEKARLIRILEATSDLVSMATPDGRITYLNEAGRRMVGWLDDETVRAHKIADVHPDSAYRLIADKALPAAIQTGIWTGETTVLASDGTEIPVSQVIMAHKSDNGRLEYLSTIIRDLGQLKQAEEILRESETRYRSLFNTIADGVFVVTPDGRIGEVNDSACAQLGYARDELIGMPVSQVSSRARFSFDDVLKDLRSQGSLSYETSHRRKNGSIVPVELSITMAEHKGRPAILGVARDITERKRAEDLTRIQRDLAVKLGSIGTLEEGLGLCLHAALDASGLDCGGICLRDEVPGTFDMPYHSGLSDNFVARVSHFDWESGNTRRIMDGEPIYATFQGLGVPLDETMLREGLRAIAVIPILHRDRVIGLLNVASHSLADVPAYSRSVLETIAGQIGGTITRLKAEEQVRRNRELLKRIAETSPAGITVVDRQGQMQFANPAAEGILGLARDQITQRTYNAPSWHITGYDGGPFPEEHLPFRQVMATGQPARNVRHAIEWPDGRRVLLSINAAPLFENTGQTEGMVAVIEDVTEQVRAEQALRQSEERYRSLVQHTSDSVFCYEYDPPIPTSLPVEEQVYRLYFGRLAECNVAAARSYGGQRIEDVLGKRLSELFHAAPGGPVDDLFMAFVRGGYHIVEGEGVEELPDGSKHYFSNNAHGVIADGNLVRVWGADREVTERRRAEETLRESEERYRRLIDNSLVGIGISQGDRIVFANQSLLRMYGYDDFGEFASRPLLDYLTPPSRALILDWRQRRARGEDVPLVLEHDIVRRDGTIRTLQLGLSFITIRNERYVQSTFVDITERERAEENLLAHQERLRSLASELSLVEERERHRIAMGLHDHACQTLVLSKMRLQQLQESLPAGRSGEITGICSTLDRTIESMREMIFDLSSPTLYKFGLEAALEELLEDKLKAEHGIHCTFRDDGAPKPLAEDVRILLFQSVRELLINAIKHAQAHKVTLDIARCNDSIRIAVADDGVGFNADEVLAAPSRHRGFGLFNIKERLHYIGGALEMESRSGQGSRFTLTARLETRTPAAKETHDGDQDPAGG